MVGCEVRKVATFSVVVCKVLSSLIAVCGDASLLRSALSISFVTSEGWNLQACFRTISSRSGTAVWAWPLKSPLSFAGSRWAILLARSDLSVEASGRGCLELAGRSSTLARRLASTDLRLVTGRDLGTLREFAWRILWGQALSGCADSIDRSGTLCRERACLRQT